MSAVKYPKYERQTELIKEEYHTDHHRREMRKVPVYRIRRVLKKEVEAC